MSSRARARLRRLASRQWGVAAIVFALSLVGYLTYCRCFIDLVDEGFLVYGAQRVTEGQVPLTDFWSYPPGRYWVLAGLFNLFGHHLLVERVALAVMLAARNALVYTVGRRLLPVAPAIAVTATLALAPGPWHKLLYSLLMFAHLELVFRYIERPGVVRVLLCGVAAGLFALFRQDAVVYAVFVTAVAVLFTPGTHAHRARELLISGGGFLAGLAPLIVYYAARGELGLALQRMGPQTLSGVDTVHEFVAFSPLWKLPSQVFAQFRGWPNQWFYQAWFPWLSVLICAAVLVSLTVTAAQLGRGQRANRRQLALLTAMCVWSLLSATKIIKQPRADSFLMAGQGLVLLSAIITVELWRWRGMTARPSRWRHMVLPLTPGWLRTTVFGAALVIVLFSWACLLTLVFTAPPRVRPGSFAALRGEHERLVVSRATLLLAADEAQTLRELIDTIQQHSAPDTGVFAFRQPMLYFLAQRDNPTPTDNIVALLDVPDLAGRVRAVFERDPPALLVVDLSERWTQAVVSRYPRELRGAIFTGYAPGPRVGRYVLMLPTPGADGWALVDPMFAAPQR